MDRRLAPYGCKWGGISFPLLIQWIAGPGLERPGCFFRRAAGPEGPRRLIGSCAGLQHRATPLQRCEPFTCRFGFIRQRQRRPLTDYLMTHPAVGRRRRLSLQDTRIFREVVEPRPNRLYTTTKGCGASCRTLLWATSTATRFFATSLTSHFVRDYGEYPRGRAEPQDETEISA